MGQRIPPRQRFYDNIQGVLVKVETQILLADAPIADLEVVYDGQINIRYGITLLGKPHLSIVPELLALDYGEFLTGEVAFDFILTKSNLYPRADVVGYRNDGLDEMIVVKSLDVDYPLHILAYADEEATQPIAQLAAYIGNQQSDTRLTNVLPTYLDYDHWLEQNP